MNRKPLIIYSLIILMGTAVEGCKGQTGDDKDVKVGAERPDIYFKYFKDKKLGLVVNQTSMVGSTHLVDTLLSLGAKIERIFAPEHGFRGKVEAGEMVSDGKDIITGLPIVSLYGKNKKPTSEQLADLDLLVFDIQDIGARFYTYISTMHYLMEACAENQKTLIILDRPNPHGHYIDGPVLQLEFRSFVGMHPIPVVHGLTVGELALMINGENWLPEGLQCNVKVIEVENYTHNTKYILPVWPSPNLPNQQAILLYPSLCFFEGTVMSLGRGTYFPFQVIGYPDALFGEFEFTPISIKGMSRNPRYQDQVCYGLDLREVAPPEGISLQHLIFFYQLHLQHSDEPFFTDYINTLAGSETLKKQIQSGLSEIEIKKSWQPELQAYAQKRKKYLLYPDFE
ncbi:MAG: DUF1343 domain-containing protein [Bacteroidetes bacterium]|nr:DUF1343 domain-containing protein [Bacteroidota bacterium]